MLSVGNVYLVNGMDYWYKILVNVLLEQTMSIIPFWLEYLCNSNVQNVPSITYTLFVVMLAMCKIIFYVHL